MCMKGGVSKTFPIILSKKLAVHQADVVNFITRAASVRSLPLFGRHLSLPVTAAPQGIKLENGLEYENTICFFSPYFI